FEGQVMAVPSSDGDDVAQAHRDIRLAGGVRVVAPRRYGPVGFEGQTVCGTRANGNNITQAGRHDLWIENRNVGVAEFPPGNNHSVGAQRQALVRSGGYG